MKIVAVLLILASAFLLFGISYILFPEQIPQQPTLSKQIPKPEQLSDQIFWAIQWDMLRYIHSNYCLLEQYSL